MWLFCNNDFYILGYMNWFELFFDVNVFVFVDIDDFERLVKLIKFWNRIYIGKVFIK